MEELTTGLHLVRSRDAHVLARHAATRLDGDIPDPFAQSMVFVNGPRCSAGSHSR